MDDALKRRLRTSFRRWERLCHYCSYAKKVKALNDFRAACVEAVDFTNTLVIPDEYGKLQFNNSHFPRDIAYWTKGFATGVMQGDDFDGGPRAWYWRVPKDGPTENDDIHWNSTPGDAFIDLIEYLESKVEVRNLTP